MFRFTLIVVLSTATLASSEAQDSSGSRPQGIGATVQESDHSGSKWDLNPQNSDQFHSLIRPQANEWRHLKVDWLTDVVAARKKASDEDKPLIVCYTGGAGYNEPLGVC